MSHSSIPPVKPDNLQDFYRLQQYRGKFWKNPSKYYPHVAIDVKAGYAYKLRISAECTEQKRDEVLAKHLRSAEAYELCQVYGINGPAEHVLFTEVEENLQSLSGKTYDVYLGSVTSIVEGRSTQNFIVNKKYPADLREVVEEEAVIDGTKVNLLLNLMDQNVAINQKLMHYQHGIITFGYFDFESPDKKDRTIDQYFDIRRKTVDRGKMYNSILDATTLVMQKKPALAKDTYQQTLIRLADALDFARTSSRFSGPSL